MKITQSNLHSLAWLQTAFFLVLLIMFGIPCSNSVRSLTIVQAASTAKPYTEEELKEIDSIEKVILQALEAGQNKAPLNGYHITTDRIVEGDAFLYFTVKYPKYKGVSLSFSFATATDRTVTGVDIYWKDTDKKRSDEIEKATDEIVNRIQNSPRELKDYEKAFLAYQWLCEHVVYDPKYDSNLSIGENTQKLDRDDFTAYGALVKGVAVCSGYANAYHYLLQGRLGIPCDVVVNTTHAWNMIYVDGQYYHVDATWGDSGSPEDFTKYFLLTDKEIRQIRSHKQWTTKNSVSHKADGDSITTKNPVWNSFSNPTSTILYFDGCYYFADGIFLYRIDDLLHYKKDTAERVQFLDGIGVTGFVTCFNLNEYHNCLYFNSFQRIYRLNPAELSEEERTYHAGRKKDLAQDITSLVLSDDASARELLAVDEGEPVREHTIYDFEMDNGTIRFHILNEPSTPVHESNYPYQLITEKLFGNDPVTITGDLKVGQNITASCGLPPATPMPYQNAVTYYSWYRADNLICTNTTGVYTLSEKDIGKTLRVDVTYDNFRGEISKSITIPKQTPTLPATTPELTGSTGTALKKILLPDGYTWNDPSTVLGEPGEHTYPATYCPDSSLYESVDVDLTVNVTECEHSWSGKVSQRATCIKEGIRTYTCKKCNATRTESIPLTSHKWDSGKITTTATTTSEGVRTYTCTVCKQTKTETIPKKTGSTKGDNTNSSGQNKTNTDNSKTNNKTNNKATNTTQTESVQPGDTTTVNNATYEITSADTRLRTVTLTGIPDESKTYSVPSGVTINGRYYQVTAIGDKAFSGNKRLTKITIGRNVRTIGKQAFYKCKNLKTIVIKSDSLTSIGSKAIKNINKKAKITCPKKKKAAYKMLFTKKAGYTKSITIK